MEKLNKGNTLEAIIEKKKQDEKDERPVKSNTSKHVFVSK